MKTWAATWMIGISLLGMSREAAAQGLTLVDQGKSEYSIYHAPSAPESVKEAARELRTYIAKATGASLPIVNSMPETPVISLGAHDGLQATGVSKDGLSSDAYRIITRGRNIFILGYDDALRNGQGGLCRGTQYGVYTFLEKYLGVRWLMPGDVGDCVPHAERVEIPPVALTEAPAFTDRRLVYIGAGPLVQQWSVRNKLGFSVEYRHGHNWDCFTSADYDRHPQVFTLRDGKRVRPTGPNAWLCTANPETIRLMGEKQIEFLKRNPAQFMESISPTDGQGPWCECAACAALDEKLPNGEVNHSRRIITFYNNVAEYVAQRLPGKALGGYLYLDYIDPPLDSGFRFRENFYPVFAPLFYYGPMAYRPDAREHFHRALEGWSPMAEGRMCFYGLPRLLQGTGRFSLPVPPGRKVLGDIYPALKRAKFAGARVDGMNAWGYGAAYNWVTARLMWDADADVNELCEEFYGKCYGKGGGAMSRLYALLEDRTEKYIVGDPTATYHMQPKAISAIYLQAYPQLEELYKQAEAAIDTPEARHRLELFRGNMFGLYRVLEDYGWLLNARQSIFYMSEQDFSKWLETQKSSIYIAPGAMAGGADAGLQGSILRTPISARAPHDSLANAEPMRPFLIRFKNHLVLQSEKEGEVRLSFKLRQTAKGGELACKVYDASGNVVVSGMAADEKEFSFLGAQGGIYHAFLDSQMVSVKVTGAAWAIDTRYFDFLKLGRPHVVLSQEMTPLYFYVPQGTAKFSLGMSTLAPGETCAATLYDPLNRPRAHFSTVESGRDRQTVSSGDGTGGWWKLVIEKAPKGALDKVFFDLGEEISPYVSPDASNRLMIERIR